MLSSVEHEKSFITSGPDVLYCLVCTEQRLYSDCVDAQPNLSLHCLPRHKLGVLVSSLKSGQT